MSRYARQEAVIGPQAQIKIRAAKMLVVGAGGLAAPVVQYLAGAGVGLLRIVDPDRVAESNLHRQTLFRMADIGAFKASVAAQMVRALNPDCVMEPVTDRLDPANAGDLVDGMDLVLDCADSFAVSYILSDLCHARMIPLIHASVVGTDGYVGGFCGGAPSLRAVFPDLPQRMGSCAEEGVLGPIVGVIGALQAQMALAQVTGLSDPLGRLISYDARDQRMGGFTFVGTPEPVIRAGFIAADEMTADDLIVDLRGVAEAPLVRPDALRLSVSEIETIMPAARQRVVLCCRSGLRAWSAAENLGRIWPGEIALVALGDPT